MKAIPIAASPKFDRLCIGCGYNLHGLPSNRCPECGKEFDPNAAYPPWAAKYFQPVTWPARWARTAMIVLIIGEAVLVAPAWFALIFWLAFYSVIGVTGGWWLHRRESLAKKFGVGGVAEIPDWAIFRRARRWLYITLAMTFLHVPQILAVAIDLPFVYPKVHQIYEVNPFVDPFHRPPDQWVWSGISPVSGVWMIPSGIYFILGTQNMAYCGGSPSYEMGGGGEWHHLFGHWWFFDMREFDF